MEYISTHSTTQVRYTRFNVLARTHGKARELQHAGPTGPTGPLLTVLAHPPRLTSAAACERASCAASNSPKPPRTVDRNRSSQPAAPSPTVEASHSGQIGRGCARNAPCSPAGAPTYHSPCIGGISAPSSATWREQLPSIGTMTIEGRNTTCEARNAFGEWVAGRGVGQSTRTKQASSLRVDGELVVELNGRRYLSTQTEAPSE